MDPLTRLGEERIREAVARGELDNLPGKGKPLELEDLSRMDPEARSAYLILRGKGFIPEEVELRRDMLQLRDLMRSCNDDGERARLRQSLNGKMLRYDMLREERGAGGIVQAEYAGRISDWLGR